MSVLSDQDIILRAHNEGMITPFVDKQVKEITYNPSEELSLRRVPRREGGQVVEVPVTKRVISYGVSSYGYDMRVGYKFRVFTNLNSRTIDPKCFDESCFTEIDPVPNVDTVTIPPNSFALAESIETFKIPRDVVCICLGKSTYARCGIIINVTPLEPEWIGKVTIEISNTAPLPAVIYPGEGIAQILFLCNGAGKIAEEEGIFTVFGVQKGYGTICKQSYGDKAGKYQNQTGITLPKV